MKQSALLSGVEALQGCGLLLLPSQGGGCRVVHSRRAELEWQGVGVADSLTPCSRAYTHSHPSILIPSQARTCILTTTSCTTTCRRGGATGERRTSRSAMMRWRTSCGCNTNYTSSNAPFARCVRSQLPTEALTTLGLRGQEFGQRASDNQRRDIYLFKLFSHFLTF